MTTYNYIHLFDHTREWGDPKCCRFFRLHWNNDIAGLVTEFARTNGTTPDNIRMFIYPTKEMWKKALEDWESKCRNNPQNYRHVDFS